MRRLVLVLVLLAVSATVLAGCGAKKTEQALSDSAWIGKQIVTSDGQHEPLLQGTAPAIYFRPDGNAIGNLTVNAFKAAYTIQDRNIKIGPFVQSQWNGPQQELEQERAVRSALSQATRYHIQNGELQLSDSSGVLLMTFAVAGEPKLTGPVWACTELASKTGELASTVGSSPLSAQFSPDGQLAGFGGVNQYNAKYTTTGSKMTIGPDIASTKVAGPDVLMAQESAYFEALAKTAEYKIASYQLTLLDASGKPLAVYIPVAQKN